MDSVRKIKSPAAERQDFFCSFLKHAWTLPVTLRPFST